MPARCGITISTGAASPRPRHEPGGQLDSAIAAAFGSKDELIAQLAEAGKTQFGSGWAWLVSKGGKLAIEKTPNAETPMAKGINCLLTVDVWEHAYYLDYQNARPKYLEAVLGKTAQLGIRRREPDQGRSGRSSGR